MTSDGLSWFSVGCMHIGAVQTARRYKKYMPTGRPVLRRPICAHPLNLRQISLLPRLCGESPASSHMRFDSHLVPVYYQGVEMHQLFTNPAIARNMAMCCCMCMCTGERPVLSNFS